MINDDPTIIAPILAQLKKSFRSGKTLPVEYRKQQLRNLIRGMEELEPEFHDALGKDLGVNPVQSCMISTKFTLKALKHYLEMVDEWVKPEATDVPLALGPGKSYIRPEPLGVALVIGPWNYPVADSVPYVASAIIAGNCAVVKPSELSPNTSHVIHELFEKYMDPDCYRCIEGQVEVAKAIVKEKFDIICFTGSSEKGKLIAKAAAENLVPYILELGGKSPTIVDKEADIENAALRITQGRFMNCGQTCVAPDYLFVHKSIKALMIERLRQKLIEFYGEDASRSEDFSRIVNDFHMQRLKSYLDEDHGGKVIVGGQVNFETRYIAPTLIDGPRLDSKLMENEIFGPILPIFEFDDIDFVINFIKDRPKPLAMYYYGKDSTDNFKRLQNETSSGSLAVNESVIQSAVLQAPFGGVGNSGQGKLHGLYGFRSFSHLKHVFVKGCKNGFPFNVRYPPYTGKRLELLNKLQKKNSNLMQSTLKKGVGLVVFVIVAALVIKFVNFGAVGHSICNAVSGTQTTGAVDKISQ